MEDRAADGTSLEWAKYTLGGICIGGLSVFGFLWNYIRQMRNELMSYVGKVKGEMKTEHNALRASVEKDGENYDEQRIEAERRFALRSDVEDLRRHMDMKHENLATNINQRFDQLTTLIIQHRVPK